jgi:hypothetical protein
MSYIENIKINPAQAGTDAGGILRVGSQTTLFDGKILNADNTDIWENVGTGTTAFVSTDNLMNMSVTSGQYAIRQAKRFSQYFSGKSQRVEVTFDNFGVQANVVKRVGYFTSNEVAPYDSSYDGFFLENDGTTIRLKQLKSGTEVLNLPITSWSGYSSIGTYQNLATWDNFTVVEFKYLWLGGAVLVMSIKTSAGFVEAHRFDYAGTAQGVFMKSPNQKVRYEIRSTTGTGSMRSICSQVASEGSIEEAGEGLALYNAPAIACNAVGTIYALIGIRKQTAFRDVASQIVNIQGNITATADSGVLLLIINPTLSAPLTYANKGRIQVAYATNQTITAGTGTEVCAVSTTQFGGISSALDKNYLSWLSDRIDNTMDQYVLAYTPRTATQTVTGIINIKQY